MVRTVSSALKNLNRDSDFQATTADQAKDEFIRDSFISGLVSNYIRQRLLENKQLDLASSHEQVLTLEMAEKQSCSYLQTSVSEAAISTYTPTSKPVQTTQTEKKRLFSTTYFLISAPIPPVQNRVSPEVNAYTSSAAAKRKYFCGFKLHPRSCCSSRGSKCHKCVEKRDFFVCRSSIFYV